MRSGQLSRIEVSPPCRPRKHSTACSALREWHSRSSCRDMAVSQTRSTKHQASELERCGRNGSDSGLLQPTWTLRLRRTTQPPVFPDHHRHRAQRLSPTVEAGSKAHTCHSQQCRASSPHERREFLRLQLIAWTALRKNPPTSASTIDPWRAGANRVGKSCPPARWRAKRLGSQSPEPTNNRSPNRQERRSRAETKSC